MIIKQTYIDILRHFFAINSNLFGLNSTRLIMVLVKKLCAVPVLFINFIYIKEKDSSRKGDLPLAASLPKWTSVIAIHSWARPKHEGRLPLLSQAH